MPPVGRRIPEQSLSFSVLSPCSEPRCRRVAYTQVSGGTSCQNDRRLVNRVIASSSFGRIIYSYTLRFSPIPSLTPLVVPELHAQASRLPMEVYCRSSAPLQAVSFSQTRPSYSESADTIVSSLLLPSRNSSLSRYEFWSLSIMAKILVTRFSGVSWQADQLLFVFRTGSTHLIFW